MAGRHDLAGPGGGALSVVNWSTTEERHRPPGGGVRWMASDVADPTLAEAGEARIDWADGQMPVLRSIRERFAREQPLDGLVVGACLHVTSETACLVRTLPAGGADVALCASNPFATQDDVAAALAARRRRGARGPRRGPEAWAARVAAVVARRAADHARRRRRPLGALHRRGPTCSTACSAAPRRRRPGSCGCARCEAEGGSRARSSPSTRRSPSARSTIASAPASRRSTASCARPTCCSPGSTLVVLGYGWTGRGVALRARGVRRVGDRLRGRSAARAGGADGGLRGHAGAGGRRARRRLRHRHGRARRAARASTSSA